MGRAAPAVGARCGRRGPSGARASATRTPVSGNQSKFPFGKGPVLPWVFPGRPHRLPEALSGPARPAPRGKRFRPPAVRLGLKHSAQAGAPRPQAPSATPFHRVPLPGRGKPRHFPGLTGWLAGLSGDQTSLLGRPLVFPASVLGEFKCPHATSCVRGTRAGSVGLGDGVDKEPASPEVRQKPPRRQGGTGYPSFLLAQPSGDSCRT